MENQKQKTKGPRGKSSGLFRKIFAYTGGDPSAIEDQEWYLDSADLRLTRIFSVILLLHIIAVGGILAFKMIDKATAPTSNVLATATSAPGQSAVSQRELAGMANSEIPSELNVYRDPSDFSDPEQYKVLRGETLTEIAVKLGVSSEALRKKNGLASASSIAPGMWLLVPDDANRFVGFPDHPVKVNDHSSDVPQTGKIHIVKRGETAWAISLMHGVQVEELLKFNHIRRPELLQIGQRLAIPVPSR